MPVFTNTLSVPEFHADHNHDLNLYYAIRTLVVFNSKFSLFFVPVYLFTAGLDSYFSLWESIFSWLPYKITFLHSAFITLCLYYVLVRVVTTISVIPAANLINKYGARMSLIAGLLAQAGILVAFLYSETNVHAIWLAAAANGLFISFYWLAHMTILNQNTLKSRLGEDLGIIQFLTQFSNMIAPLLSGLVIVSLGFSVVFAAGVVIMLLAILFALLLSQRRVRLKVKLKDIVVLNRTPSFQRIAFSAIGKYANDAILLLWPLYLYILFGEIDKVGYLYAFSYFIAMTLTLLAGFYIDHNKGRRSFLGSGSILAGVWLGRIFIQNPLSIAFIDAIDRIVGNFHWLFYDTTLLKATRVNYSLLLQVARELALSLGAIIFWFIILLLFLSFSNPWAAVFVLASVGVLISLVIRDGMDNVSFDEKD